MVSDDGTEVTVEGAVEDQEVEKDEDGQEVIKVYIFKADSGEDDMGEQELAWNSGGNEPPGVFQQEAAINNLIEAPAQ